MAFWIVHFLVLLLVLNAEGQIDCKYETAIANCFCSTEINILQNVRIIEIQSESCNCTINFLKAQEQPPTVVHVFNKLCNWLCNEIECGKFYDYPHKIYVLKSNHSNDFNSLPYFEN